MAGRATAQIRIRIPRIISIDIDLGIVRVPVGVNDGGTA